MDTAVPPWSAALDAVVDDAFQRALAELRGTATALAVESGGLEPIDLPPGEADPHDNEWLAVAGALYLAANLEAAGVVVAAETISGLVAAGGLGARLSSEAADAAVTFWRGRGQRLVEAERLVFYGRIFGALPGLGQDHSDPLGQPLGSRERDDAAESALISLSDALLTEASQPDSVRARAARCRAAADLADVLLRRAGHIPTVVAGDLISSAQLSLALLRQPSIMAALNSRSAWGALQQTLRRYRGEQRPVALHVGVGRDGVVLLGWLRAAWPEVAGGACSGATAPREDVALAAASWLRGSLALHDGPQRHGTPTTPAA